MSLEDFVSFSKTFTGKVTVHFGGGSAYPGSAGGIDVEPGKEAHVVFEAKHKFHARYLKDAPAGHQHCVFPISPKEADATKTGLADESVDELHIHNVLSDPANWHPIPRDFQFASKMFQEARRILKPGGTIYVGNTMTPWDFQIEMAKGLAERFGFDVKILDNDKHGTGEISDATLKRFGKRIGKMYGTRAQSRITVDPGYYLLQLTKRAKLPDWARR